MAILDQRILDVHAHILRLEREKLEREAQDIGSQDLPIADKKAAMKALAQENYRRHSLAAAIAVSFQIPDEDALFVASELMLRYRDRSDLQELVVSGQIYAFLREIPCAALRQTIAWRQIRESLSEKPGVVGDPSCKYNARSQFVRCAVNPVGPCEGCGLFEGR